MLAGESFRSMVLLAKGGKVDGTILYICFEE